MPTESEIKEAEAQAAAATEAAATEAAAKEVVAKAAAAKEAEAQAAAATEAAAKEAAAKDAELPEWARSELTRVRDEAAKSRIGLRDVMAKLEGAKTPEEFADLKAENVALAQELARTTVGTAHKLPPELIAVLQGKTPEELEAHAKVLSKFVITKGGPDSLHGGLDPNGEDGEFDPVKEAHKARANRY